VRSHTIDLEGPVHYVDFGGRGRTLILVHGLGGSHLNWLAVGPALAEDAHVLALDLPGFGRTPRAGRAATLGSLRRTLHRFLDRQADGRAVLIGNSMGGLLSMLEAAAEPDRVAGLVLVDPAVPRLELGGVDRVVLALFAALMLPGVGEAYVQRRLRRLGPEGVVRETLAMVCQDPGALARELVDAHLDLTREQVIAERTDARALAQATRSLVFRLAAGSLGGKLDTISAPALVIHGAEDRLVPLAAVRQLVDRTPGWRLEVFGGVGHVPQMEVPDRFVEVVRGWLTSTLSAAPAA
jgi:pimeloyl-ACP methyl ester carboxylesterase